jgi:hypothetical protein
MKQQGAGKGHMYNPSYSEGRNQEEGGLKPDSENSFQDPNSKIYNKERVGVVAQVVQHLLNKHEALSSNPVLLKKKKDRNKWKNIHPHPYSK